MTAWDVLSPCPGWEGKAISATPKNLCVFGTGPSALSSTRGGNPQPYPPKKSAPSAQLSHPCIPLEPCSPGQLKHLSNMGKFSLERSGEEESSPREGETQGGCNLHPNDISYHVIWEKPFFCDQKGG